MSDTLKRSHVTAAPRRMAGPPALDLLPCPFCGGTDLELANLVDEDDYFVHCNGCDVQQIAAYSRTEAAVRWNRRGEPPSVIEIVEDRMRRAFAGEDVGPTSGLTYGDMVAPPSEEEVSRRVKAMNAARGEDAPNR